MTSFNVDPRRSRAISAASGVRNAAEDIRGQLESGVTPKATLKHLKRVVKELEDCVEDFDNAKRAEKRERGPN